MSFVLEALRKSEQERQQATAPGLGVLFPAIVEERTTSKARPVLIAGMVVMAIAALMWFLLRPRASAPVSPVLSKATATAPEAPKAAVTTDAQPIPPLPKTSSTIAAVEKPKNSTHLPIVSFAPASDRTSSPAQERSETPKAIIKDIHKEIPKDTTKSALAVAPANLSATTRPVVALPQPADGVTARDVSPALPKNLPEMTIAGYIHDDQAGSMAMINDKLVREGEEISPGLRLEKILPDGAIFSYRGEHFRR
jgi:general secretion pathway protein B